MKIDLDTSMSIWALSVVLLVLKKKTLQLIYVNRIIIILCMILDLLLDLNMLREIHEQYVCQADDITKLNFQRANLVLAWMNT